METATTTLTLPLDHLYYLTADPANTTGYTLEQVSDLIKEKGGDFVIEATITHPVPPPYTVEGDIAAHEQRIADNQGRIDALTQELAQYEEGSSERAALQEQIDALEADIVACQEHIAALQTN